MSKEVTGIGIEDGGGAVAGVPPTARMEPDAYAVVDLEPEGADPDRLVRDGAATMAGGISTDEAPA